MKKTTTRLGLMAMLFLCSVIAFGQVKKTITGIVKDSTGNGLPGASVFEKGKQLKGVITNESGQFTIETITGATLIFSAVGYEEHQIKVGAGSSLTVLLSAKQNALSEVVITGFGESRQKRNLGYAVTQVSGEDIRKTAAVSPIDALQGQVPGLQVQAGISGPGATSRFLIRGNASLDPYGNQPLIVMDGIVMDEQSISPNTFGQFGGGADFGNILKNISPDDIESISVLKGGAVTSLYGSKASNGVILIKTKKGNSQKGLGVTASQLFMLDQAYKTMDLQNKFGSGSGTDDFSTAPGGGLAINPATYGWNVDWGSWGPPMLGQTVLDVNGKTRANNPMPHNALDMYRTGINSNSNVAFSAGNDVSTLRFAYNNQSYNGISLNNQFIRNSITARATHKISNVFSVDVNLNYTNSKNGNPQLQGGASPMWQIVMSSVRNYDTKYWMNHYIDSVNGGLNQTDPTYGMNSLFYRLYQDNQYQKENNFRGAVEVTAKINSWLNFLGGAYVNFYNRNVENEQRGRGKLFGSPYYSGSLNDLLTTRYRGTLNANRKFRNWDVSLQAGAETNKEKATGISFGTGAGLNPDIYRLSNSSSTPSVSQSKPNISELSSVYFQGGASWRNFLSFNIYGRNDWNSTLVYNDAHGKYSYFYYGADAALVFTDLWKNKPGFIDYGKLRVSYNSAGGGTTAYTTNTGAYGLSYAYTNQASFVDPHGNTVNPYSYQSTVLPNQNLIPTHTSTSEIGLELRGLDNRLGLDFTYYNKISENQIIQFGVPVTSGVSSTLINGGKVSNKGVEISLSFTPVRNKDFSWTSRINFTKNLNKVLSLPYGVLYQQLEAEDGIRTVAKVGAEYGILVAQYGYARYQAKDANGKDIASPLNGQRVLSTIRDNTQAVYLRAVNYGTTPDAQEPVIGSTQPKFMASWKNSFTYKNFTIEAFVDAKIGGLEYSTTYFYGHAAGALESTLFGRTKELGGVTYTTLPYAANPNSLPTYLYNGLKPNTQRDDGIMLSGVFAEGTMSMGTDGQKHDVSGMTFENAVSKGWATPVDAMDFYVYRARWGSGIREAGVFENSWVSLRQVSIGYNLPRSVTSKIKMNNLRVSVLGNNLIYLYNSAPDHINPENLSNSGSGNAFERGGVPYVRSMGVKVEASF